VVVELDFAAVALLAAAALLAGAVNSVAGGGSLISFPALLLIGYPSVTANATNIVAVLPGYLSGSLAYRRELGGQGRRARALGATSAIGALAGAALLLVAQPSVFELAAPFLILLACAVLAAGPLVERAAQRGDRPRKRHRSPALHGLVFAAAVYGGYFGAALGIMLLAVLVAYLEDDLQRVNALKGLLSLVIGLVSAVYLALLGPVVLLAAGVMAVGSLLGGQVGVSLARRLSSGALRWVVVVYGVGVAVALLVI
jgi:uncharacterized membrane protein YfcA